MIRHAPIVALAGALLSCASTAGTAPRDMGAAAHERAAEREEASAAEHRARYDADAWRTRDCRTRFGERRDVCWSEPQNPTAVHLAEAEERARAAERHRAASKALRDAEATACAAVALPDRDESPFAHRDDILAVDPLVESGRTAGAEVRFRAVQGLTAERLRSIAACHAARNAVLGRDGPHSTWCPLAVPEIRISTVERPDGAALRIRSADEGSAEEVLRRSRSAAGAERGSNPHQPGPTGEEPHR